MVDKEQQENENTGKETYIIVGIHRQKERYGIQDEFFIPNQTDRSQRNQRQQRKAVQPHDIPLIAQRPCAHGIESAEEDNGQIILLKGML